MGLGATYGYGEGCEGMHGDENGLRCEVWTGGAEKRRYRIEGTGFFVD